MQSETWAGVIGSILLVIFLIVYRIIVLKFFKKRTQEVIKQNNEKKIMDEASDSKANSTLESMCNAVKNALPKKIEDGVEWREQNLTPELFEYVYYVDKSKSYTETDFKKIRKNMIKKKGNIKNIADLCDKTGRSLAFRYIFEKDGSEQRIILNSKDF